MVGIGRRRRQGLGGHERILAWAQPRRHGVKLLLAVAGTGALAFSRRQGRPHRKCKSRRLLEGGLEGTGGGGSGSDGQPAFPWRRR